MTAPGTFKGRLKNICIDLDGVGVQVNLSGQDIDPAVIVASADPSKPNPIVQALSTTPPAKRFTLTIEVYLQWPDSITCPKCGMTSHNMHDIAEGYCGNCHEWTQPGGIK